MRRRVGEAEACAAMEAADDAESSRRSDADPWRRACGGGRGRIVDVKWRREAVVCSLVWSPWFEPTV